MTFEVNCCFGYLLFQLSEQEVETVLDKCMVLFRFLQEKVTDFRLLLPQCIAFFYDVTVKKW